MPACGQRCPGPCSQRSCPRRALPADAMRGSPSCHHLLSFPFPTPPSIRFGFSLKGMAGCNRPACPPLVHTVTYGCCDSETCGAGSAVSQTHPSVKRGWTAGDGSLHRCSCLLRAVRVRRSASNRASLEHRQPRHGHIVARMSRVGR